MADGSMAPLRNRMVPWPTELTCQGALALLRSRRQKPAILRVPSTAHSPIQNKTLPFSSRHSSPPHDPGHSNEAASHVQTSHLQGRAHWAFPPDHQAVPVSLSSFLRESSIINQAFDSRLRLDAGPINADGFGVGWYDTELENSVPCVFQAITPAWSNRNLFRLAEKIRSPLVFAHVRASTTGALSEENCHPWMYGSLLWMHNGHIPAFSKIKRHLQNELSEEFFQFPQGSTDSEWAFALFLNELSKVADPKASSFGYGALKETMLVTIEKLKCWWVQAGATEPCRMNFAVADGHSVVATKYVTSATEDAASLYFSTGTAFEPHTIPIIPPPSSYPDDEDHHQHPRQADQYRMRKFDKREKIVLIASEPLTFEKTDWIEVPCQTLIVVTPKMNVLQFPIIDEFVDNIFKCS
ncbi:hypothetical protein PCASD_10495 [Puccinia coronata f. sp. avenae]|uniref:Glutamine amidotransferase type-2 domain-containing protein n=1 Tax=Puccinia coronata f. sp. avenae TaxID=200324 RepID=A0A2N5TFI0_9BASI|nr:hypothetical protein PCASD_10495 [Puccinia coronata f. sp. avenae]